MGIDYVDIFYHHRPDPETPMEETMETLASLVKQGKALYIGLSSYSPKQTSKAQKILKSMGTRAIIHQVKYSMLVREPENGLFSTLEKEEMGCIAFSSLAQGILTEKYLSGVPSDSRAASGRGNGAIEAEALKAETLKKVEALTKIAKARNQSMAQLALSWTLRQQLMTSLILGASKTEQVKEAVGILNSPALDKETLAQIDAVLQ
jgi:L-glyceraldehyde 3-phosphate reductase